MSKPSPLFGWTIAESTELVDKLGQVLADGILDIENSLYLADDSKAAIDPYTAYPKGISMVALSSAGASSGGWPDAAGMVFTLRHVAGSVTHQIYFSGAISSRARLYTRIGGSTGWSVWTQYASPSQPRATASGRYTFNNVTGPRSVTIAFPTGTFSGTPVTVASGHGTGITPAITGESNTGFTLSINATDGSDYAVNWIAMENYS